MVSKPNILLVIGESEFNLDNLVQLLTINFEMHSFSPSTVQIIAQIEANVSGISVYVKATG